MFKKNIAVVYWHGSQFDQLTIEIKHNTIFKYTKDKRNELIDKIMDLGYNVMLQSMDNGNQLAIWIDKGKFG